MFKLQWKWFILYHSTRASLLRAAARQWEMTELVRTQLEPSPYTDINDYNGEQMCRSETRKMLQFILSRFIRYHPDRRRRTAAACTAVLPHHSLTMSNGKLHNVWGDKFIKPSIWPGAFILPAELPLRLLFWVVQPGPLEQIFLHFFFSSMLCFQTFSTVCVRMESIGASGKRRGIPSSITSVTLQLKLLMWVHAWNGCASEINFVLFASLHRTLRFRRRSSIWKIAMPWNLSSARHFIGNQKPWTLIA